MRSVFDLFKTRVRNLARARLLASQLVRFCRCDDQSRTINLFQSGHPVHSEKIRYQHGDAQAGRRFHASGDEPINRPFRLRLADNGAHHAAQIFFLMRLIDCEHFELRRHLFWARSDSIHAISDRRIHQHKPGEIMRALTLDVSGEILHSLRPTDQHRPPRVQSFEHIVQILCAHLRRVAARCYRRLPLRARIESDHAVSLSEAINLLSPNISGSTPTGNKNQSRPRARLARFDYAQRHASADIHLSLA